MSGKRTSQSRTAAASAATTIATTKPSPVPQPDEAKTDIVSMTIPLVGASPSADGTQIVAITPASARKAIRQVALSTTAPPEAHSAHLKALEDYNRAALVRWANATPTDPRAKNQSISISLAAIPGSLAPAAWKLEFEQLGYIVTDAGGLFTVTLP